MSIYIPILAALISGIISFSAANLIHAYNKRYKKIEKSIDIAKEFSNIITEVAFDFGGINKMIIEELNLTDKFNMIESNKKLHFDYVELKEVFTDEEVNLFMNFSKVDNVKFLKWLIEFKKSSDINFNYDVIKKLNDSQPLKTQLDDGKKEWKYKIGGIEKTISANDIINTANELIHEYNTSTVHTLNKLEWIAMNFTSNIANEKIIYQSLHQVYLKTCLSGYIIIANRNREGHEKYYLNLIEHYNNWNKRKQKAINKHAKLNQKQRRGFVKTKKLR